MELATLWAELGIPPDYAAFRNLTLQVEAGAGELVSVAPDGNLPPILLTMPAAAAWASMHRAASGAGITLIPVSGFRSVAPTGRNYPRETCPRPKPARHSSPRRRSRLQRASYRTSHRHHRPRRSAARRRFRPDLGVQMAPNSCSRFWIHSFVSAGKPSRNCL